METSNVAQIDEIDLSVLVAKENSRRQRDLNIMQTRGYRFVQFLYANVEDWSMLSEDWDECSLNIKGAPKDLAERARAFSVTLIKEGLPLTFQSYAIKAFHPEGLLYQDVIDDAEKEVAFFEKMEEENGRLHDEIIAADKLYRKKIGLPKRTSRGFW